MLPGVFVNGSNIQLKRIPFEFLFGCVEITTCGKTLQSLPLTARTLPRLLLRPWASGPTISAFEVAQPMTGGLSGALRSVGQELSRSGLFVLGAFRTTDPGGPVLETATEEVGSVALHKTSCYSALETRRVSDPG